MMWWKYVHSDIDIQKVVKIIVSMIARVSVCHKGHGIGDIPRNQIFITYLIFVNILNVVFLGSICPQYLS